MINVELVNNKNIVNYFNIYSNSFKSINNIAKNYSISSNYLDVNNNLIIPSGIDSFISEIVSKQFAVTNEDFNTINYFK